jgi:hypothetical protein
VTNDEFSDSGHQSRGAFHKSQAMGNRLTRIEDIAPLVVLLTDEGTTR